MVEVESKISWIQSDHLMVSIITLNYYYKSGRLEPSGTTGSPS